MFIFDEFELPDLTRKLLHVTISKKFGNLVDFRNCVYNIMPIMLYFWETTMDWRKYISDKYY